MKIQFASDLHLENTSNCALTLECPMAVVGDILVLAGDIFVIGRQVPGLSVFWDWCSENFAHTFIVPGNHEFYDGYDIDETLCGWEMELRHNVRCVCNRSVVLDDVELFFTTLWADVPESAEAMVNKYMAECQTGCYKKQPFRAEHYSRVHKACRKWLDGALSSSRAARKVVVTHHCPVQAEDPRYESNGLSTAFVNAMEGYVESSGVDAWLFGHTHYNGARGRALGNTALCTNQLGYVDKGVCADFENDCVIEI